MIVLVTGSAGRLGHHVVAALSDAGHEVRGFDLATGGDVRDITAVQSAVDGAGAVVHLAAIPWSEDGTVADLMSTNVAGTWNVLVAASASGVRRFVGASSVNALGVFLGLRAPDYLPIDDDHPCYATSPYGASKFLGEELCALVTRTTGMSTICLRLPWVIQPHEYARSRARDSEHGRWEYGAFIDSRDAAQAMVRAVDAPVVGHHRLLVAASDALAMTPPVQVADRRIPDVRWTARAEFEADRWRPLVRTERAQEVLGWSPVQTWAANVDGGRAPAHPSRWLRRARAAVRSARRRPRGGA